MTDWKSEGVQLTPSFAVDVRVDAHVVIFGAVLGDCMYASDLAMTPKQARAIAALLMQGADKSEEMQKAAP